MKNLYHYIILLLIASTLSCSENVPVFTNDWDEDVYYFGKNLKEKHVDLFFKISKSKFDEDILALRNETKNYSNEKVIFELSKIISNIGDSHTQIQFGSKISPLPLKIDWFDDGFLLSEVDGNNIQHLGNKITGINGLPIMDVIDNFRTIIPYENESNFKNQVVAYLRYIEFYNEFGINNSTSKITFNLDDGNDYIAEKLTLETFKLFNSETPLFLKNRGILYWFEELTQHNIIYIQYNSCQEQSSLSFEGFTDQIDDAITADPNIKKIVIDMRHNGGGNSSIMKPLINKLEDYVQDGRFSKENIFLIVGRKTFSSALINSIEIKEKIDNVVIGEPTGGKPNHYGEVRTFNLPNSNLKVNYSTKYFELSNLDEDSLEPDIFVPYNSEHLIGGIDPILDQIKNF